MIDKNGIEIKDNQIAIIKVQEILNIYGIADNGTNAVSLYDWGEFHFGLDGFCSKDIEIIGDSIKDF